jgi:hypothetical protein
MRKRAKRPEWEKRVTAWDASGESAGDFAKRHGWNPRTLAWWKRKIAQPVARAEVERGFVEIVAAQKGYTRWSGARTSARRTVASTRRAAFQRIFASRRGKDRAVCAARAEPSGTSGTSLGGTRM